MDSIAERRIYRGARKTLHTQIKAAQERFWVDLCTAVDNDPWGLPYHIVTKRLPRQVPGTATRGRELDLLFPKRPLTDWQTIPLQSHQAFSQVEEPSLTNECQPITLDEFNKADARLPRGKATSPDGVPNKVLSVVARKFPDTFIGLFNRYLSEA